MVSSLGTAAVENRPRQAWKGHCEENSGNLRAAGQDRTGQGIIWGWERKQEKYNLKSSGHTWGLTPWPHAWLWSIHPLQ